MIRKAILGSIAAAALAMAAAAPAGATILTETLHNAVFANGGTATGFFEFDTATSLIGNYSITVAADPTSSNFGAFTYTPSNGTGTYQAPGGAFGNTTHLFLFSDPAVKYINLATANPLPIAGGVSPLVLLNGSGSFDGSYEQIASGAFRLLSGELVGAVKTSSNVPEPATLGLFALGMAAIARSRRRHS